tara:strand:- start:564 stop:863 length:300 start_codon:yes stop_codon:yes gene_type:complete
MMIIGRFRLFLNWLTFTIEERETPVFRRERFIDFEFAYRELENDQYFLYKFLFKISDFKESLFVYLENNLNIFPEWQNYLDFLIRHRKIENNQNKIINF